VSSPQLGLSKDLAQLALVVERLPTGVIIVDKEGLEVTYANASARRLLHPVNVRVGRPLPEPWKSFSLVRYVREFIERGAATETRVQIDDDRAYMLNGLTGRGERTAAILFRDITRHARRGRAEREFIANAAHELLTPLTGIVGSAHVLEAGAKHVPEDRDRFIAHIAAECSRLARIARSLLVLARAQSGEEPPRLEIVGLRPVLEEVAGLVDAEIVVRGEPNLTVLADVDLLMQALTNLVANAERHGGARAVVVQVRQVEAGLVELDVCNDDGRAIELDRQRTRFRSAAGRDGGGFGLGLSIAEQSLEVMGGHLFFDRRGVTVRMPAGEA
jgi:signal transduction histidine kinase